jgi:hypothetical protein
VFASIRDRHLKVVDGWLRHILKYHSFHELVRFCHLLLAVLLLLLFLLLAELSMHPTLIDSLLNSLGFII